MLPERSANVLAGSRDRRWRLKQPTIQNTDGDSLADELGLRIEHRPVEALVPHARNPHPQRGAGGADRLLAAEPLG
jgi:hypothetical protein